MKTTVRAFVLAALLALTPTVPMTMATAADAQPAATVRNLADPAGLEDFKNVLKGVKAGPGRQSELLKTLSSLAPNAKAAIDPVPPPIDILGISTDDGSQVATTAIVVPTPDVLSTNLTLILTDADGTIIDINTKASDLETPITLTIGPGPNKAGGAVDAIAQVHIIYKSGGPGDFFATIKGAVFPSAVTNLAPLITKDAASNKWVQVCIDRATASTAKPPACNYVFGSVPKPPGVMVPVQGSIKYPGTIDTGSLGKPKNAQAMLIILNGDSDGQCRYVDLGTRFLGDPNTKAAGDTLTWSLDPAVFASSCADAAAFYTFALAVKVDIAGKPSWGTISNAVNGSTKTSIAIPRLQIAAGCIETGTPVTLATGQTAAIETLKVGDALKSENYTLTLAAIATGYESRVVTVTTEGGEHVTLSLIHPVITERGPVQARDLHLDDELTTTSGKSKIVKLVQEVLAKPVQVYDLVLTPPPGTTQQGWTLFAGNLLVGDGTMKIQLAALKP